MKSHLLYPIRRYLAQHRDSIRGNESWPPPLPELKLCIVIPSLAERWNLPQVLDSLVPGSSRCLEAEVLVVVNNPSEPAPDVLADNLATLQDLGRRPSNGVRVLGLDCASPGRWLPQKQAGVGLARRIGMDAALQRLEQTGQAQRAAIACLDADSPAGPGYIDAVLNCFDCDQPPAGALCSYRHPQPEDKRLAVAMMAYELWLRYIEAGLRFTGSPFAYSALGSCMVASARGYALADGMPPRQAAEDFHFLQKLVKANRLRPLPGIPGAQVFPAARVSQRVLFGTGKAMQTCLSEGMDRYLWVEPADAFYQVRDFFCALAAGFEDLTYLRRAASPDLQEFLTQERAWPVLEKIRRHHPHPDQFVDAVHQWFDGLRIIRYLHQVSQKTSRQWLFDALLRILPGLAPDDAPPLPGSVSPQQLALWLECLRA